MAGIPKGGLLLAGLAAFAYYKYSKMSDQEKRDLVNNLKDKGQKLYDQYMPEDLKKVFKQRSGDEAQFTQNNFSDGTNYTTG
ncbi:MAG: hypothetical protein ACTHJ5_07420 [Ilyomonas sp.]